MGSRAPTDRRADPQIDRRILTGLSSGEGLIHSVRDPAGQDPGATDRRLLVIEPEFVSVLKTSAARSRRCRQHCALRGTVARSRS